VKTWNVGFKWRYVGEEPYTPYDLNKSSLIEAWTLQPNGYLDYSKFNSKRLKPYHQLDIRIDKMYYLKKWTLNFYIDIQNLYNFKSEEVDKWVVVLDQNNNPIVDPSDPDKYMLKKIKSEGSGTILPTVGIIVEF